MGTNFYKLNGEHIGRMYIEGLWCWDCKVKARYNRKNGTWECPNCHQSRRDKDIPFEMESFENNRKGISMAKGFVWHALDKKEALKKLKKVKKIKKSDKEIIPINKFWDKFDGVIVETFNEGEFC